MSSQFLMSICSNIFRLDQIKKREFNYTFFYKQHFMSNTRLNLAKEQAETKQQPETELSLFEYSVSSCLLLSKSRAYCNECVIKQAATSVSKIND